MALGQFSLVDVAGQTLAVRGDVAGFDRNFEPHDERPRLAPRFETYIRDVVAQRHAKADYFTDVQLGAAKIATHAGGFSRGSYLLNGNFRWQSAPGASFVISAPDPLNPPPAGGVESVGIGVAEWNATASDISYEVGGADNTAVKGLTDDDGKHSVLFGDPNNETQGALAVGGAFGDVQYTLDGEQFIRIVEADIVVAKGLNFCVASVMTHEMGHTLGIRHSNEAPSGTRS
jgi:hypothetical protein